MALAPASSGGESVIAEVEMNAGADQGGATVRVTVVQASSVFYDTPATLGACGFALSYRGSFNFGSCGVAHMVLDSLSGQCGTHALDWCCAQGA